MGEPITVDSRGNDIKWKKPSNYEENDRGISKVEAKKRIKELKRERNIQNNTISPKEKGGIISKIFGKN